MSNDYKSRKQRLLQNTKDLKQEVEELESCLSRNPGDEYSPMELGKLVKHIAKIRSHYMGTRIGIQGLLAYSTQVPLSEITPAGMLTKAEFNILKELASGSSNEEISEKLFISVNTVRSHLKMIYLKLDVPGHSGRVKAIRWYIDYYG